MTTKVTVSLEDALIAAQIMSWAAKELPLNLPRYREVASTWAKMLACADTIETKFSFAREQTETAPTTPEE